MLLLSKSSLKKADTYINFKYDKVQMFDRDIDVCMSTNRYYTVEILSENVCNFDSIEHCLIFEAGNDKYNKMTRATIVIKSFLQNWIGIFGSLSKVFSDNEGEFVSEEFSDFCENFNIKINTTPAESPWCNGICEQHIAILTEILWKVKDDINCQWDTALALALSGKNSLIKVSGFSAHQLVFGKNVSLPPTIPLIH